MRNMIFNLLIILMAFSVFICDAEAKRFGGGKSFGMSRQASSFNKPSNSNFSNSAISNSAAPKPASTASKWLGPLAGLAAGGLLASLFMGHGLGGALSSILMWVAIGVAILFVIRLFRGRTLTQPDSRHSNQHFQMPPQSHSNAFTSPNYGSNSYGREQNAGIPTDFNEVDFLRSAKATFIRLQTAFDNKNLADIREFTAPEIFAEIQLQIQERGETINVTEVISIDAELLDVTTSGQTVATVLFSGLIREEQGAEPVAIKEMWHFTKDLFRSIWVVSGIQQS